MIPKVPEGHVVDHVSLSRVSSQGHVPLFPAWLLDYNWALGRALLDLCACLLVYAMARASPATDAASDTTLTFTSFSLALGTPFDDSSLLSPPGLDSTLGSSIGLMGNKNGAYIQLLQQYELIQNELRTEKMEHNRLK